ncbi:MAG: methyl-accepting chemotaxis protein, partial [Rectinema sp.]|nr:methyl-accepting chemotaxis protein [Rectinema sp.]
VAQSTKDLAHNVAEAVSHTDEVRKEGIASLEAMSQSIERIKEQMEKIAQSILNLSEQSQAIAEIISAVDDIAEQSNLLAVNAAIEAAKAGEQGKGFSVVAQEVKSLADQSKQSTRQVRKILSDIQKATSNAIMATEQGNKEVALGVEKSREVNAAIESLSDSIQGSTQLTQQITYANDQQLTGIEQINMAMDNIKVASRQNVDAARNLEQAVNTIKELSTNLKTLVERYKV